jgi:hypothetical protein
VSFGHLGFSGPPIDFVPIRVEPDEVKREVAREPVLGRHIQHSRYLTQDGFAIVLVFVAFDCHNPIGLVNEEVDPGELLRPLPTERNHGFTVRRITNGCEELVQPFLSLFSPLVSSFGVVPLEVGLQSTGRDIAGLTFLHGTHERTVVVVNHRVFRKVVLLRKRGPTIQDIAFVRSLSGVGSGVVHQVALLRKSGPTVGGIALERPLARMNPFVHVDIFRRHFLAALPEPAENLAIRELLPLRCPAFANRGRWRWAGPLRA